MTSIRLNVGGWYIVNSSLNYDNDPPSHEIHEGDENADPMCGLDVPNGVSFVHEHRQHLAVEARERLELEDHNCRDGCEFSLCCRSNCFG